MDYRWLTAGVVNHHVRSFTVNIDGLLYTSDCLCGPKCEHWHSGKSFLRIKCCSAAQSGLVEVELLCCTMHLWSSPIVSPL